MRIVDAQVHSRGFLHRDIKPDNFELCRQVHLVDYGTCTPWNPTGVAQQGDHSRDRQTDNPSEPETGCEFVPP